MLVWWQWIVIVVIIVAIAAYLYIRRISKRIKSKPLEGIPCPPLSHPLLGHPDKMTHPFKHELRLDVCDAIQGKGVHQLLMMKYVSVFINDCEEAARVLLDFREKGPIYSVFRFDTSVPDLYTSDGAEWNKRHRALAPALYNSLLSAKQISSNLMVHLQSKCESGGSINLLRLFTLLALDIVCEAVFHYKLGGLTGSSEGIKLVDAMETLSEAQAGSGYFPSPTARKVSKEEAAAARATWRAFLNKLMGVIRTEAELFQSKHGSLTPDKDFTHALYELHEADTSSFTSEHVLGEVHQALRHGHECIAGQLTWIFVALHRNTKVRRRLEEELDKHDPASNGSTASEVTYPEYLEAVVKEVLRRYPVTGNATVRSVTKNTPDAKLMGTYVVPEGTPLHIHMWTLHNTTAFWNKPKNFMPERWLVNDTGSTEATADADEEGDAEGAGAIKKPSCPRCKFDPEMDDNFTQYDGVGPEEGTLTYFPFSAGDRICPGRFLSLGVLRGVLAAVAKEYHLDPVEAYWAEDLGSSATSTVIPSNKQSLVVNVTKRGTKANDGWADDSDEEK